jgi:hypothetical protein
MKRLALPSPQNLTALMLFSLLACLPAQAQSMDERARIGRLQSAQSPCPTQPSTDAERYACSQRAMAREIGRQDGYCWTEPNQASNSPAYRCEPRRNR